MRFVPAKTVEQQGVVAVQRTRELPLCQTTILLTRFSRTGQSSVSLQPKAWQSRPHRRTDHRPGQTPYLAACVLAPANKAAPIDPVPVHANLALYPGTYKNINTEVVGFAISPLPRSAQMRAAGPCRSAGSYLAAPS